MKETANHAWALRLVLPNSVNAHAWSWAVASQLTTETGAQTHHFLPGAIVFPPVIRGQCYLVTQLTLSLLKKSSIVRNEHWEEPDTTIAGRGVASSNQIEGTDTLHSPTDRGKEKIQRSENSHPVGTLEAALVTDGRRGTLTRSVLVALTG